jgi:hypothetical protein
VELTLVKPLPSTVYPDQLGDDQLISSGAIEMVKLEETLPPVESVTEIVTVEVAA